MPFYLTRNEKQLAVACQSLRKDWALRFSSLVTKSRPWPVIGRTIFFTSDKNRPTNHKPAITHRDEIYFINFWRENLSMYRINWNNHFTLKVPLLLQSFDGNPNLNVVLAKRNEQFPQKLVFGEVNFGFWCLKGSTRISTDLQVSWNHTIENHKSVR